LPHRFNKWKDCKCNVSLHLGSPRPPLRSHLRFVRPSIIPMTALTARKRGAWRARGGLRRAAFHFLADRACTSGGWKMEESPAVSAAAADPGSLGSNLERDSPDRDRV